MRSFRYVYDEWLHRRPLLTKMATSSVLFGLGDRLSKRVEKIGKTEEELDELEQDIVVQEGHLVSESTAKTVRMMLWGGMIMSPMMHTWYNLVERVFVGSGKLVVAKKVVADMVFIAPQMPIWFFTTTGVMAGKPFRQALDDSIEKQPMMLMANYMLWPAANSITYGVMAGKPFRQALDDSIEKQPMMLMANYMLWPAANSITYGVMPLQYRLLLANFVNVGWASVLSYMATHPVTTLPFLPSLKRSFLSEDDEDGAVKV